MPPQQARPLVGHPGADPELEGRHHSRTGAPGDMEARHGVAVGQRGPAAPLGPADDREPPDALRMQPGALLAGREVEVGLRPAARPEVLLPVEPGGREPVLGCELEGVPDAETALLGGVDEEEPAERPPGLAAEGALRLLVEHDHPLARVEQLRRGHQSRQPCSHDDRVRVRQPDSLVVLVLPREHYRGRDQSPYPAILSASTVQSPRSRPSLPGPTRGSGARPLGAAPRSTPALFFLLPEE